MLEFSKQSIIWDKQLPDSGDGYFCVVLTTDNLLQKLAEWGPSTIGIELLYSCYFLLRLDAIFKLSNLRIPFYVVTSCCPSGKGVVHAVIVTNDLTHKLLKWALEQILVFATIHPKVMIDHDGVE